MRNTKHKHTSQYGGKVCPEADNTEYFSVFSQLPLCSLAGKCLEQVRGSMEYRRYFGGWGTLLHMIRGLDLHLPEIMPLGRPTRRWENYINISLKETNGGLWLVTQYKRHSEGLNHSSINPLNTKCKLLYLKTQFVPRSKHFSSRL